MGRPHHLLLTQWDVNAVNASHFLAFVLLTASGPCCRHSFVAPLTASGPRCQCSFVMTSP